MIKYIIIGAAVVVSLGATLVMMKSERVTAAKLQPGQVPLQKVLSSAASGNVAEAWDALGQTGVRQAVHGSSYQSLRTAEAQLKWMWPSSRSKLVAEALKVANDIKGFARTIKDDLGDDPAATFENRHTVLMQLADELDTPDHLLVHRLIGQALRGMTYETAESVESAPTEEAVAAPATDD